MCEMEIFKIHCESTKSNVQDICGAAKVAEEMKSVFPLIKKAFRLVLTALQPQWLLPKMKERLVN